MSEQEKENLLFRSRRASSPLQLKELAHSDGIELSDEMADKAYAYIQKGHKLNLQDLDRVSAGGGGGLNNGTESLCDVF